MEAKEIESFQAACKAASPTLEHAPPNLWNLGESNSTLSPCEGETPPWNMRPQHNNIHYVNLPTGCNEPVVYWNLWESNPPHQPCRGRSPPWNMKPLDVVHPAGIEPAFATPVTDTRFVASPGYGCIVGPGGVEPPTRCSSGSRSTD